MCINNVNNVKDILTKGQQGGFIILNISKGNHYVYVLKDSRDNTTFYVGKGLGSRLNDHKADTSEKGLKIQEITNAGGTVVREKIAYNLTEAEAYEVEARLISLLLPTEKLLNQKYPTGKKKTNTVNLFTPLTAYQCAQTGKKLLEEAIINFITANDATGVTNAQIAEHLGLRSSYGSGVRDYLTYSVLGLLLKDNKIKRLKNKKYIIKN